MAHAVVEQCTPAKCSVDMPDACVILGLDRITIGGRETTCNVILSGLKLSREVAVAVHRFLRLRSLADKYGLDWCNARHGHVPAVQQRLMNIHSAAGLVVARVYARPERVLEYRGSMPTDDAWVLACLCEALVELTPKHVAAFKKRCGNTEIPDGDHAADYAEAKRLFRLLSTQLLGALAHRASILNELRPKWLESLRKLRSAASV